MWNVQLLEVIAYAVVNGIQCGAFFIASGLLGLTAGLGLMLIDNHERRQWEQYMAERRLEIELEQVRKEM